MKELKFKDFDAFVSEMRNRLEKGHIKYGNDWFFTNLGDEMEAELLDLANYAYLLYRKVRLYKEELKKL